MNTTFHSLTIGTRGSALARWQSDYVADLLRRAQPGLQIKITVISTRGDRELDKPLPEIGGKGLFTAELEAALLSGKIDIAVHSLKDLPVEDNPGLTVGAIPQRAAPGDVLISRARQLLANLPDSPRIGTSSLRRAAQIKLARPDAQITPLRGNVDTRIRKAHSEDYDAIILAEAGLVRLGLQEHIIERLSPDVMLPAPGQGALGIHCRAEDANTLNLLREIHHAATWSAVTAERAFLARLGGGCSLPVAAFGEVVGDTLLIHGLVAAPDGSAVIRVQAEGQPHAAQATGANLADEAARQGASRLLALIS